MPTPADPVGDPPPAPRHPAVVAFDDDDASYSIKELADLLGVSVATIGTCSERVPLPLHGREDACYVLATEVRDWLARLRDLPHPPTASSRPAVIAFDDDSWFSTEEFARRLGIARSTLANRRWSGLPMPEPVRVGRRHFYSGREIRAWLQAQRVGR